MSKVRLLLVEDEFLIRSALAEALADDGFEVVEAADGIEAMRHAIGAEAFALLLTDLQLPTGPDGIAIAGALRRQQPNLPVIFLTGQPAALTGVTEGAPAVVIAKPYLPSAVCALARRLTGPMSEPTARA